jgi:hypothetical protein
MKNNSSTIKKSYLHKNSISTGNLFFDKILGGFSLGTTVLLIEDNYSKLHQSFVKYYLADGMVKKNKNIILDGNNDFVSIKNNIIEKIPYKSTQVESLLNAKKISDLKNDEIKIAWRYENIKYSNIIEDIVKSSPYVFDISRQIQEEYRKNLDYVNIIDSKNKKNPSNYIQKLDMILGSAILRIQEHMGVMSHLQAEIDVKEDEYLNDEDSGNKIKNKENLEKLKESLGEKAKVRVFINDIFSCLNDSSDINPENNYNDNNFLNKIKSRLMCFKNVARSTNGVFLITVNPSDIPSSLLDLFHYYFDYVFKINSFMLNNADKIEDYDGIFKIEKIPRINALKMPMHNVESESYGLMLERRKLVIEQVDIGVEVDRTTKVKEKDLNPTGGNTTGKNSAVLDL